MERLERDVFSLEAALVKLLLARTDAVPHSHDEAIVQALIAIVHELQGGRIFSGKRLS